MRVARAVRFTDEEPAAVIEVVDVDAPVARPGWSVVDVRAASLNRHDLWSIAGVGVTADDLPLPLGSDVAGVTADGREVLVHSLVADPVGGGGDELLDPRRKLLADAGSGGGLAEQVLVPTRNLVDKPAGLTFEQACCLPTAWLTAYHMLFVKAALRPGRTVLVQGAGGGVSTAVVVLGAAAGLRVWATSRSEEKRARAVELGADRAFATGERLPERVDVVIETVGGATWDHSVRSTKPGGSIVVAGATAGAVVSTDLNRLFLQHISVIGSAMGRIRDLQDLVSFCVQQRISPPIDSVFALDDAAAAIRRLSDGDAFGKIVVTP
ncbi:zinc-binding dehydrogenase [Nakamurella sp. YIM 132087]|uniref:Zinc-binding dehydrogenase n=1 Tax=Nakamurella alba TaxID=2665158 RepID=A0A7K1FIG8_9ACTN|nr:zinc-binding dehydrogenase [Nakamurella alba]MTD13866.1 zinc-binding dehydrogenase [Nakamurella alba]